MEEIDAKWIKARLPPERGARAALAEAMNLGPDKITKILNGTRKVQAREIPAVLAFFEAQDIGGLAEDPAEFKHHPFAEPLRAPAALDQLARLCCPDVKRPFYYVARRAAPLAAILPGDVLVISHGTPAQAGALALVSRAGPQWEGSNELRRYLPPLLATLDISGPDPAIPIDSGQDCAIIGEIRAVLRAPGLIPASDP
jgi:hypothetical protein